MSLLYSKLRLQIPQVSDGKNATITSPRGVNRTVPMNYPLTDVFVGGMDKYTVQAGTGSESFSVGNGKLKKIVTEDASALTVATMPTKTRYLVGENLDLSGAVINATIQKGDGSSNLRNVTSQCNFTPPNGTQLNILGTQKIDVEFESVSSFFNVSVEIRQMFKKIPYKFRAGSAVVWNNEIHLLGGYDSTAYRKHYKWNGTNWISVSTLPYVYYGGSAVVWNNEIHIFGGAYDNTTQSNHYKWDGLSWTSVETLPFKTYWGAGVLYNNKMHLLGGVGGNRNHYEWDGTTWTQLSDLPFYFDSGSAVVYNNEIHLLGGSFDPRTQHYKWNGVSWTSATAIPYAYSSGSAVVFNNSIYLMGQALTSTPTNYVIWNGSNWSSIQTMPYYFLNGSAVVYNTGGGDEIILLGSSSTNYEKYDAQYDGTSWTIGTD